MPKDPLGIPLQVWMVKKLLEYGLETIQRIKHSAWPCWPRECCVFSSRHVTSSSQSMSNTLLLLLPWQKGKAHLNSSLSLWDWFGKCWRRWTNALWSHLDHKLSPNVLVILMAVLCIWEHSETASPCHVHNYKILFLINLKRAPYLCLISVCSIEVKSGSLLLALYSVIISMIP